jgi:serine/threonine protein kinase
MSPQMVDLLSTDRQWADGYSYMTDYWSLGAMVYQMLTGKFPFRVSNYNFTVDNELRTMKINRIEFPKGVSAECVQFISSLLKVDETSRLGYGLNGLSYIQKHPFFGSSDFDWSQVMTKRCKPPIIPSGVCNHDKPMYNGFKDLPMSMVPRCQTAVRQLNTKDQELFKDWYVLCISYSNVIDLN